MNEDEKTYGEPEQDTCPECGNTLHKTVNTYPPTGYFETVWMCDGCGFTATD